MSGPRGLLDPIVLAAIAVAILLRVPPALRAGLWLDEVFVLDRVTEPLARNFRTLHFVHYLAIRLFREALPGEFGLRAASICFGVASVPLAYAVGRGFHSALAGRLLAVFVAVVPWFVVHSIDSNYYAHMMFWTLATLWVASRVARDRRPAWLLAFPCLGAVCFFVHPFSALFFVSTGLWLLADAIRSDAWYEGRDRLPAFLRSHRKRLVAVPLALAAVGLALAALLALTLFGRTVLEMAERFASMLSPGKSPTNIEFSLAFFDRFFRRIGPAYFAPEGFARGLASLACLGFFVAGTILSSRRDPLLPALFLLPFVVSFGLVFNLDAGRFFAIRYVSYLAPIYWLGIAIAAAELGARIARARGRRADSPLVPLSVAGIVVVVTIPQQGRILFSEAGAWDRVMAEVARRSEPREPIVDSNWAEQMMLPHYMEKYGIRGRPRLSLSFTGDRERFLEEEFKRLCQSTPSLWYLSSSAPWLDDNSAGVRAWAARRLETVATGASLFDDSNDVTAYRWNLGGRMVYPPSALDYRPPAERAAPASEFRETFLFEKGGSYRFDVRLAGGDGAVPRGFSMGVEGTEAALVAGKDADGRPILVGGPSRVEAGLREFVARAEEPFALERLEIFPYDSESSLEIEAWNAWDLGTSLATTTPRVGDEWLLRFGRNGRAIYRCGIADEGDYWIGVEARHDAERKVDPLAFELRVDGASRGVLAIPSSDWQTLGARVRLPRGNRELELSYLNERSGAPARERDAWVRRLVIRPARADDVDARAFIPRGEGRLVPLVDPNTRKIERGWKFLEAQQHDYEIEREGDRFQFRVKIPRNSLGVELESPKQPVFPGGLIYYSAMLRTRNLRNHSANARTRLYDRNGEPMKRDDGQPLEFNLHQEGLGGTSDWTRFSCFRVVPPEVGFYSVVFWVYPNGRKPSEEAGEAWFGELRIEAN